MLVLLNREGFEPTLPDVAACLVVLMIPPDMRRQQPLHPAAQVAILARPEHQMKVVRHQAIRQHPHRAAILSIVKESQERGIVVVLVEDGLPSIAAANDVVGESAGGAAFGPGHAKMLTRWTSRRNNEA